MALVYGEPVPNWEGPKTPIYLGELSTFPGVHVIKFENCTLRVTTQFLHWMGAFNG